MFGETLLFHVISKAVVDESKIPRPVYKKFEPLAHKAGRWLPLIENFDPENPASWVKSFLSVSQNLIEPASHPPDPIRDLLRAEEHHYELPSCLEWMGEFLLENSQAEFVLKHGKKRLTKIVMNHATIYFLMIKEEEEDDEFPDSMFVSIDKSVRQKLFSDMAELFWTGHKAIMMDKSSDDYIVSEHEWSDRVYKGEMLDFIRDMKLFEGHRRVVLLQGKPGTGKSTLCMNAAKELSNRTVILTTKFIESISREEWELVFKVLIPDMVIVDDIDRVGQRYLEASLHLFEDIYYKVPITLLTTNDFQRLPDAFRRPGRIEHLLEMPEPSEDVKKEVLEEFVRILELDPIPDALVPAFLEMLDSAPGAHVKELLVRCKVYGYDYKIPENDINFRDYIKLFQGL